MTSCRITAGAYNKIYVYVCGHVLSWFSLGITSDVSTCWGTRTCNAFMTLWRRLNKTKAYFSQMFLYIRKSNAWFEGSQASPNCPSGKWHFFHNIYHTERLGMDSTARGRWIPTWNMARQVQRTKLTWTVVKGLFRRAQSPSSLRKQSLWFYSKGFHKAFEARDNNFCYLK